MTEKTWLESRLNSAHKSLAEQPASVRDAIRANTGIGHSQGKGTLRPVPERQKTPKS